MKRPIKRRTFSLMLLSAATLGVGGIALAQQHLTPVAQAQQVPSSTHNYRGRKIEIRDALNKQRTSNKQLFIDGKPVNLAQDSRGHYISIEYPYQAFKDVKTLSHVLIDTLPQAGKGYHFHP